MGMRALARMFGLCILSTCWCGSAGCRTDTTRVDFVSYDDAMGAQHHHTEFTRACYRRSPNGTVEIVLRAESPSQVDPTQMITQVFHVREFWKPRLGTTYAEATQINAQVQYAVITPPTGVRYDGAAFLTYRIKKRTGVLTAEIESGNLSPRYRMGGAVMPFGPVRFTGTIVAIENGVDVVDAVQTLGALFRPDTNRESGSPSR